MTIFLYSDPHFSHEGVCKFTDNLGNKIRPWTDPEKMNEELIEKFNKVVTHKDKVYFLGDIAIKKKGLECLQALNGDKILIKGNHDIYELKEYTKYFRDIRGYHVLDNYVFSHIPVHKDSLNRYKGNIHGHLHTNRVMLGDKIDPNYFCVCVEQTNYEPIAFEEVKIKLQKQKEEYENNN